LKSKSLSVPTIGFLIALFCFAYLVRIVYLFELVDNPLFDAFPEAVDHWNFNEAAVNFSEGDWLARSRNNAFSPLYKYFLGILYWISSQNFYFIYGVQFFLGALSSVLIYLIGRNIFNPRAGLFAFVGFALFTTQIIYEGILLRASFISFLGVLSFYCLLRLPHKRDIQTLIFTVLILSFFFQARPNTLLCLPLICVYLSRQGFGDIQLAERKQKWKIFWATLILSLIPLLVQCYIVHGKFVFFDASGPHTFISGNLTAYSGVGFDLEVVEDYQKESVLGYASNIKYLMGHIFSDPVGFFLLYVRKLFFFFNDFEPPTNISVYLYKEFTPITNWFWNHFSLFTALGLTGILVALKRREGHFLLGSYIGSLTLAILIFLNESRYRIPVIPYYILFAGYGLDVIIQAFRSRAFRDGTASLLAASILFYVFQPVKGLIPIRADDFNNMAQVLEIRGKMEEANSYLDRGLALFPENSQVQFNKGLYHYAKEEYQGSVSFFEKAFTLDPSNKDVKPNLAKVYFKLSGQELEKNQWREAATHLSKALKYQPKFPEALVNLGIANANMGFTDKAAEQFNKALAIDPKNSLALTNLKILKGF
jgi:tetratricopeptide (TPR) repeat protein